MRSGSRTIAIPGAHASAAFFSLMAGGVTWGLTWWPLRFFADRGLTAYSIVLIAYGMVTLVSLPVIWRERHRWWPERYWLLAIGLCFGWANFAFTAAMMMGPVVRAMLLFYLLPAWGAIGGKLVLNETLGARRMLAVALSLGGVAVMLVGADGWGAPLSLADITALTAGLGYSGAAIANRKAQSIPIASRTLISFAGCSVPAVLALPFIAATLPVIAASTWAWLIVFAFVWLLGATLLTTYGTTHLQASRAAVLQVVELVVAVVSAVLLGGETLSRQECLGGAMIVAATLIEARR
ncbi:MAG: DMT family transporter [Herminiimonas sp.]|nr:DMT family transporter [Herminiimonas sp.]